MKTKINKRNEQKIVQSHSDRAISFCAYYNLSTEEAEKAIDLLDKNLKKGYTHDVMEALKGRMSVSRQVIRLVKAGVTENAVLFNFLLDYALKMESLAVAEQEKIKKKLTA